MKKALSDFAIFTKFWVFKILFFLKIALQPLGSGQKMKFLKFFKNVDFHQILENFPKMGQILEIFFPNGVGFQRFLAHFCTSLADARIFLGKNDVKSAFFEKIFFSVFLTFFRAPKQKKDQKKRASKNVLFLKKVVKTPKTPFFAFLAFFPIFSKAQK